MSKLMKIFMTMVALALFAFLNARESRAERKSGAQTERPDLSEIKKSPVFR